MNINSIVLKSGLASSLMAGYQIGVRQIPINKNLFLILGIVAGSNAIAEIVGQLLFSNYTHTQKNILIEPLMASALMFGGFVLSGYTDFNNVTSAALALSLGFGLNLGSDMMGDYLLKM